MLTPISNRLLDRDIFMPSLFDSPYKTHTNEGENEFVVEVALPGLNKDDINITAKRSVLHISAEHQSESKARQVSYKQSFTLPDNLDVDNISAKYEQGILTVKLPKLEQSTSEAKQVKIE